MKKPDILPGKREISYSHGHAHITRDGEPFVNLQLGREGRELHAEGVHFKLAPDARFLAAAPAMAEALERALFLLEENLQNLCDMDREEDQEQIEKIDAEIQAVRATLTLAGYEF